MTFATQLLRQPDIPPAPAAGAAPAPFGDDGLTFRDLIDLVNPLHHVPILGNLYRKFTGDVIDPAMRIAGGALFGGPLGAGFAAASVAVKHAMTVARESAGETPAQPARHAPAPGGWMVAAARPVRFAPAHSAAQTASGDHAVAAHAPVRRGGWMAQAAYAMADSHARATAAEARERIDTTA